MRVEEFYADPNEPREIEPENTELSTLVSYNLSVTATRLEASIGSTQSTEGNDGYVLKSAYTEHQTSLRFQEFDQEGKG